MRRNSKKKQTVLLMSEETYLLDCNNRSRCNVGGMSLKLLLVYITANMSVCTPSFYRRLIKFPLKNRDVTCYCL